MAKKRAPTKLVVLSDLHVGSTVGIWPDNFEGRHGFVAQQSAVQRWLWKCWQDGTEWLLDQVGDNFILGLNGDLIDGVHHGTNEVMSVLVDDHAAACIELLRPIASRARMVVGTLGTESHTGQSEHSILAALNGRGVSRQRTAMNSCLLEINGVETELMHHIGSAGTPWTEASGHSQALNRRRAERARLGHKTPTVLIRGHRHRFGYFCDGHGLTVVTPSWQVMTRWAWKTLPGAECHVGFTILDYEELQDDAIPQVRFRLYSPTPEKAIRV